MKRNLKPVLTMAVLLAAMSLVATSTFATSQTVTPGLNKCTQTGTFSSGTGLLVIQEIGTAPVSCTIGVVVSGSVAIYDPPSIDGGELSDVLVFAPKLGGGSTATLYSFGEVGFPAGPYSVAYVEEDNSGIFPYTLYSPACACGPGLLTLSDVSGHLTVSGITDNAYVVVSNTDEVPSPEPATPLLLGATLLGLGFFHKRLSGR